MSDPWQKVKYKAFTSSRFFGVEMEVNEKIDCQSMGKIIEKIDPSREVLVTPGWTMTGANGGVPHSMWSVKTDSTCATNPGPGQYGHEVASPKLMSHQDILLCGEVADSLRKNHCEVNHRCGVHVHVDIGDWSPHQTGIMLANWIKTEEIIAQILPSHRRSNQYAKFMRKKHRLDYAKQWKSEDLYAAMEPTNLDIHQNREKRVAINLIGYATGLRSANHGRKTAELRLPEGSLDRYDIENWTRLYVHFINESSQKTMPSSLALAPLHEVLVIFGLAGHEELFLLSPELYETKTWLLKRILKFTNNIELFRETVDYLNRLTEPVEKFVEIEQNSTIAA